MHSGGTDCDILHFKIKIHEKLGIGTTLHWPCTVQNKKNIFILGKKTKLNNLEEKKWKNKK